MIINSLPNLVLADFFALYNSASSILKCHLVFPEFPTLFNTLFFLIIIVYFLTYYMTLNYVSVSCKGRVLLVCLLSISELLE